MVARAAPRASSPAPAAPLHTRIKQQKRSKERHHQPIRHIRAAYPEDQEHGRTDCKTVTVPARGLLVGRQEACMAKRSTSKRELIDTGDNKMFGKRDVQGRFKEMDDVGQSSIVDRRRTARTEVTSGHGDQGDRRRAAKTKKK